MNERRLYYFAIAASVAGIFMLFLLPQDENSFFEVAQQCSYKELTITGRILSAADKGSLSILTIADASYLPVVVFGSENYSGAINQTVKINARLSDYMGKKELVASEIKFLGKD
ncbi:hypothetical protein JXB11_05085 [Candidatus Woesearchaeota archaeon]|nr:hypothetical protein [Candidatus Woesearchaeota archaeon]